MSFMAELTGDLIWRAIPKHIKQQMADRMTDIVVHDVKKPEGVSEDE